MALSRSPLMVVEPGAFSSAWACFAVSQFPRRTPLDATPFTRVMPLARSGASSPLSAASTANFRTAVIRTLSEGNHAQSAGFQGDAPRSRGRFREAGPCLPPVPLEKLVQA